MAELKHSPAQARRFVEFPTVAISVMWSAIADLLPAVYLNGHLLLRPREVKAVAPPSVEAILLLRLRQLRGVYHQDVKKIGHSKTQWEGGP